MKKLMLVVMLFGGFVFGQKKDSNSLVRMQTGFTPMEISKNLIMEGWTITTATHALTIADSTGEIAYTDSTNRLIIKGDTLSVIRVLVRSQFTGILIDNKGVVHFEAIKP